MLNARSMVGLAGVVGFAIVANLMLKLGASEPASNRIILGIFTWRSAVGLTLFGCGGLLYALLLRWIPLNVAQSFTAAQFIGVVTAASLMLKEPISPARWIGISLIATGILLVGFTARA